MLKLSLCDYSNAYILMSGNIASQTQEQQHLLTIETI